METIMKKDEDEDPGPDNPMRIGTLSVTMGCTLDEVLDTIIQEYRPDLIN